MREAAVFRLLRRAAGISHTHIRSNRDVRASRIAVRRDTGRVKQLIDRLAEEDLADARNVIRGWRLGLQYPGLGRRIAGRLEPQERNVVFSRTDLATCV